MSGDTRSIRIDDLRRPVLTGAARDALRRAEADPVDLSEEAVLSAAQELTGLSDFGSDSFRNGLRRRVGSPVKSAFFRSEIFRSAVHNASLRLLFQDLIRNNPEISNLHVGKPIIIAGPARSGTTYLQGLLATDPRLRVLRHAEALSPFPSPHPIPESIRKAPWFIPYGEQENRESVLLPSVRPDLLPLLDVMLELGPHDVAEETLLMAPNFPHPSDDMRSHSEYLKLALKALQWQRGPDRWILKSPNHLGHIAKLMSTFPDATVVMTHRDPVALTQSQVTMAAYAARLGGADEVDVARVFEDTVTRIENLLRARIRDQELIPESNKVNVLFHQLTTDTMAVMERVYQAIDLDLTAEQRARIVEFQSSRKNRRPQKIAYDFRAYFDADPNETRERFSFYFDEYPVNVEIR